MPLSELCTVIGPDWIPTAPPKFVAEQPSHQQMRLATPSGLVGNHASTAAMSCNGLQRFEGGRHGKTLQAEPRG